MKYELTAKRLKRALDMCSMKPQELSEKSGVSKSSISQYINGSHTPSNISSGKMSAVLDVNPLWLMGFDVSMNPSSPNVDPSQIKDDIPYTEEEKKILIEFRNSDDTTKQMVKRLLSYTDHLNKEQ